MESQSPQAKSLSVFAWTDAQHEQIDAILHKMAEAPQKNLASQCMYLAHQVQKACAQQPVGILASLQLNRQARFRHIKELFTAVLCELIGKELKIPPARRLFIVCAAISQDLGMIGLQENTLDKQPVPLSDGQKKQINKHPDSSRTILEKADVKEPTWLEAISQHHEQPDGSGYPKGLRGKQISIGARILRVADAYVAMTRPRGDRPAFVPKDAIKEIFLQREKKFDTLVARTLNSLLGLYPPGLWVRLASGEIGVVSNYGSRPPFPIVSVILSADGEHLNESVIRDTQAPQYTVVETVLAPFHFSLSAVLNSMWPEIIE